MKRYDWESLAREYITTNQSLMDLSHKYGVSISLISKHSKREKWVNRREEYRKDTNAKIATLTQLSELNKFSTLYEISDRLDGLLNKFSKLYEQEDVGRKAGNGMPCREMAELSKAFKTAIEAKRDLFNIPSPMEVERQKIALERLQIDRDKARAIIDAAKKEREPIVIKLEGEAEDLAK